MMKGKIFTAYHFIPEPGKYRADDLFVPVVMGYKVEKPLVSDQQGTAPYYAPLTTSEGFDEICVKWYVWKNLLSEYDWFGFQQYRRPLFGVGNNRSNDEIRALAEQYDVIVPGADVTTNDNSNMRETFKHHFHVNPSPWDVFERLMGHGWNFTIPLTHPHNCWIMRRDEFDRYMKLWTKIFIELSRIVRPDPPRVYGYITERFFTLYLDRLTREHPETKVLVLPGIQDEGVHREFLRITDKRLAKW